MVDYMHLMSFVEMPSTIFHMTCVMLDCIWANGDNKKALLDCSQKSLAFPKLGGFYHPG